MHTFPCRCGRTITIDPPSELAGYVVWDADVDAAIEARRAEVRGFLAALTSGRRDAWMRNFYGSEPETPLAAKADADVIEDILAGGEPYTRFCYRCDSCGRLYVQTRPRGEEYQGYLPEEA